MQKKVWFYNKHGEKLAGILHIPKKTPAPAVVVCHGFTSSKVNKGPWCEFLRKQGFVVLRFDFNGCGESQGDFLDFTLTKCIEDLEAAVDFLKKQKIVKKRIGIAGHSLGGQIVMVYAANHRIDAVCPISAVFTLDDDMWIMKDVGKWKKSGVRYFDVRIAGWKRKKKGLGYNFILDRLKYDMRKVAKKVKCPVLIIHGDKDDDVPLSHGKMYYKNVKSPKRLIVIKGAEHAIEKKKDLKILYEETANWFKKYL